MAGYVSVLMLCCPPGRLDEALGQFMQHGVLQICRDAVPGFIRGRLMRAQDDPVHACVICEWTDRAAFEQWMAHPQRNADLPGRLFEPSGRSALFELVQDVGR
jgi:heme-degrading monooxygenase HmoA